MVDEDDVCEQRRGAGIGGPANAENHRFGKKGTYGGIRLRINGAPGECPAFFLAFCFTSQAAMYNLDGVALSGSLLASLLNEAASPYAGSEPREVC